MPDPFKGLENERQRARPRAITSICHPLGPSEGDSHGKREDELKCGERVFVWVWVFPFDSIESSKLSLIPVHSIT